MLLCGLWSELGCGFLLKGVYEHCWFIFFTIFLGGFEFLSWWISLCCLSMNDFGWSICGVCLFLNERFMGFCGTREMTCIYNRKRRKQKKLDFMWNIRRFVSVCDFIVFHVCYGIDCGCDIFSVILVLSSLEISKFSTQQSLLC